MALTKRFRMFDCAEGAEGLSSGFNATKKACLGWFFVPH
jgi:hypothetical protein